jgi:hypothetical protein
MNGAASLRSKESNSPKTVDIHSNGEPSRVIGKLENHTSPVTALPDLSHYFRIARNSP